jgi:hypothetical protein
MYYIWLENLDMFKKGQLHAPNHVWTTFWTSPQDLIENLKLDQPNNLNLPTPETWTCFLAPALKSSDQFPK